MTLDDALKIVERQTEMLTAIHNDHAEYRVRLRARLQSKIERMERLDRLEFCAAQDFGLLTPTGAPT